LYAWLKVPVSGQKTDQSQPPLVCCARGIPFVIPKSRMYATFLLSLGQYVGSPVETYMVCPKSNENDIFCTAQKGQERKVVIEAGGEGNQVYNLTFFSSVYAFVAVGTLAKCVVVCVLSWAKMQRSLELRYAIEFCAKLGKSGSETLQLLRTAYEDAVLSSAQVFRWHKALKDGMESFEDERRAGRPSTSRNENNVARVKAVLDRGRRLNVR